MDGLADVGVVVLGRSNHHLGRAAVGPIALDVSLLSLVGVLIAYLIARSLF